VAFFAAFLAGFFPVPLAFRDVFPAAFFDPPVFDPPLDAPARERVTVRGLRSANLRPLSDGSGPGSVRAEPRSRAAPDDLAFSLSQALVGNVTSCA
jgi:hypothetical protein